LDGDLVTNGLAVTTFPNSNVLAGGFYVGSDSNGVLQAHGMFDDLSTYDIPLNAQNVANAFTFGYANYYLNPANAANISSASTTNYSEPILNAITGPGFLQSLGSASNCVTDTNVWFATMKAQWVTNFTVNFTFDIEGGSGGVLYDVFATAVLGPASPAYQWAWMGQGYHCNTYMITNLPNASAFFRLGTAQDSDFDGLTDAYELLVSHTDPFNPDTDGDGISDLDEILSHTDPLTPNPAIPSAPSIQRCPQ
jgi:hypothetical protein